MNRDEMNYNKARRWILDNYFDGDDDVSAIAAGDEETMAMVRAVEALSKFIDDDTKICDCYHEDSETVFLSEFEQGVLFARTGKVQKSITKEISRCWGTKEKDICSCGGDKSKCDFYEHNRMKYTDVV